MKNGNTLTFDDNEIIIRISPSVTDDTGWTGDLDINIEAFEQNTLKDVQYNSLISLAQMMASLPLLMEEDDSVLDKVGKFHDKNKSQNHLSGQINIFKKESVSKDTETFKRPKKNSGKVIRFSSFQKPKD